MLLPLRLEWCSLHYDYTLLYIIYRTTDDRQQTIDNGQQSRNESHQLTEIVVSWQSVVKHE